MIDVDGTLYGTTSEGGTAQCEITTRYVVGCGTVYSISKSGSEKVLYSFRGGSDGWFPKASLLNVNGTICGTTTRGGVEDVGTVYAITTRGAESVLYSFGTSDSDGYFPTAPLINLNGTLYGTTAGGGHSCEGSFPGCGTVYRISKSGKENVLYSFTGPPDGQNPTAGLLYLNGTLYGTTSSGGSSGRCNRHNAPNGCGTVFSLTTSGAESVLHSFSKGSDGALPSGSLLDLTGTLYGTTTTGGGRRVDGHTWGTVFAITP